MSRFDADITVVGAGPAGQAMALATAQAGFDTLLIDAGEAPAPIPQAPDLRVFAVSPASTRLLASLGAWPPPAAHRVCAYRRMHVWERDPGHGVHFDAAMLGWPALGHIVEHGVLQHALAEQVAAVGGVRTRWRLRVESLAWQDGAVVLRTDVGDAIRSRLLIGADGAASPVRRLAGIDAPRVDYGQHGLVANVRASVPHADTARQRFLPTGPLAFLPLADGACSIVWSLPTDEALRLKVLPAEAFQHELAVAAGGALGTITLESERASFPLARQSAERYVGQRIALVGDAAHVVHPLAGQGLNLGLLDVAALADVLADVRERGMDPGNEAWLSRYARWRQGDNALAARAFEAIDRLYAWQVPGSAGLRDVGHRLVDRSSSLKRAFVMHASGLAGRVPSRCAVVAHRPSTRAAASWGR